MNITIEIPIKPHLKMFLLQDGLTEPVKLSRKYRNPYTSHLMQLLTTPPRTIVLKENREIKGATLVIEIPIRMFDRNKIYLGPSQIYDFNILVDDLFKKSLLMFLEAKEVSKGGVYISIEEFLSKYEGMEDHISRDSLARAYYRSKKKEETDSTKQENWPRVVWKKQRNQKRLIVDSTLNNGTNQLALGF